MGFVVILSRQRWRERSLNTKRILETSKCDTIHATMTYRLTSFISTAVNTRSKRTMSLTGKREPFSANSSINSSNIACGQNTGNDTDTKSTYQIYLTPPKKQSGKVWDSGGCRHDKGVEAKETFLLQPAELNIKLKEKSNLTYCQNLQIITFEMKSNYTPWKCVLTDLAE